jgi:hypothetical protein
MGFVVYSKRDGEMLRYYDTESKARAQVTGHNRRAIVKALKGDEYVHEWDMCEWAEYEQVWAQHYDSHKWYYLNRSNF